MERPHRAARADRVAVAREAELPAGRRRPGLPRGGRRARRASPPSRRRGRRCRSRPPRRRRRAARARRAPSPPPPPRRRPRVPRGSPPERRARRASRRRSRPRRRRGRRRSSPGSTVSRAATMPAGARLGRRERQPACAQEREDVLLDRPLVAGVEPPLDRRQERRFELVGARLRARLDDEVDVDLEVAGADRRLHPVAVAARLGERLRDRRLADAEEAQRAPSGRPRPREERADGVRLERVRPQPLELRGRAGQDDDDPTLSVLDERGPARCRRSRARRRRPGRSPASSRPERSRRTAAAAARPRRATPPRSAPRGRRRHGGCARAPARPSRRYGRRASGRDRRRRGTRRPPRRAGARPRARPGRRRRSRSAPARARCRSASRARNGPLRSVRSPRTSSLPVTTMNARGRFAAVNPRARCARASRAPAASCGPAARRPCRSASA